MLGVISRLNGERINDNFVNVYASATGTKATFVDETFACFCSDELSDYRN